MEEVGDEAAKVSCNVSTSRVRRRDIAYLQESLQAACSSEGPSQDAAAWLAVVPAAHSQVWQAERHLWPASVAQPQLLLAPLAREPQ